MYEINKNFMVTSRIYLELLKKYMKEKKIENARKM